MVRSLLNLRRARLAPVAIMVLGMLAACTGDTPTGADNKIVEPQTGSLIVTATGLPQGIKPSFKLERGSVLHNVVPGSKLDDVEVGTYTLVAQPVNVDGYTYDPHPASQSVAISVHSTTTTSVSYTQRAGTVNVTVTGLPQGIASSIILDPPLGANIALSGTAALNKAVPGTWRLTASPVSSGGVTYVPSPTSIEGTVVANQALNWTVVYTQTTGSMTIAVDGLPGGANAQVTVTGPNGFNQTINATATLTELTPGTYTIAAAQVVHAGVEYRGLPSTQQVDVAVSTVAAAASVTYTPQLATLVVNIAGVPQGVVNVVQVTGPFGFVRTISATSTFDDVPAGQYTISATPVTTALGTWAPAPASQQVTIDAGETGNIGVVYSITTGSLAVQVVGLPPSANAAVQVTGPIGFNQSLTATKTFVGLVPGVYTITSSVVAYQGSGYAPSPASQQVTVNAALVAAGATVTYAAIPNTGQLTVTIGGLPAGVNADVTVTGAGTNIDLTASHTLTLPAGTYTVTAASVSHLSTTYDAAPVSQDVTVNTGQVTNAQVNYVVGSVGANDDLSVSFAYVTQATQRPDGSVTLVANRDALLRVFVVNNQANNLTPSVRARIYEGATLLQTVTIPAPESSVRTSIAEGVLSSTWNTVIPAANVRPNMRILVDVDPSDLVTETNESNNVWPATGVPKTVTVVNAPTFNVRFVPVKVGALQGNVSDANKNQYLVTLRKLFPISDVNATVRLPFTSSATVLQAGDGNGQWGTVLSEMNNQRVIDGAPSNMHYYGVVRVGYTSGIAGYGYVPGRAAIGWDHLPSGDGVAAHEFGHNFNRPHSPCGPVANPDPNYPYGGGFIGTYGWNSTNNSLVQPSATDIMGYCGNQWISDYTWSKVVTYRQVSGMETSASYGNVASSAKGDGLLVWGRISNGKVTLEPSFRVQAPPTVPASRGSYRLEVVDRNNQLITSLAFEPQRVDHVFTHEEQHFSLVLPWSERLESLVASVRIRDVRSSLVAATRTSRAAQIAGGAIAVPELADPSESMETAGADRVRVRWNSNEYPMAMVRDANTGQIIAFVRNPGSEIIARNGRPVDLVFSDGVRSVVKRKQR